MKTLLIFHTHAGASYVDECVRRARADGREDLIPVIERMAGQYEPVTQEECDAG